MQINRINFTTPINKEIKVKEKENTIIQNANTENNYATCPTNTLKAYNNVSFGKKENIQHTYFALRDNNGNLTQIRANIPTLNGGNEVLNIDTNTIEDYISAPEEETEQKNIADFLTVYTKMLSRILTQDEQENAFLTSIATGENKPTKLNNKGYLNPNSEINDSLLSALSSDGKDFVKDLFNNIANPEVRQNFANALLSNTIDMTEANREKALAQTLDILDSCRSDKGYDLSNLDVYSELIEDLDDLKWSFGDDFSPLEFIEECKDKDGSVDFDFAHKLKAFMRKASFFTKGKTTQFHSQLLKRMLAKSPKQKEEISKAITEFAGIYTVVENENFFERQFEKAFNPITQEFDTKAYSLLKEIQKLTEKLYDNVYTQFSGIDELNKFNDEEVRFIEMYMNSIKNEQTGEVKVNHQSPQKFINQFTKQ